MDHLVSNFKLVRDREPRARLLEADPRTFDDFAGSLRKNFVTILTLKNAKISLEWNENTPDR
jgi:hypothetical protein